MPDLKFGEVYVARENVRILGHPNIAVMVLGPAPRISFFENQVQVLILGFADRAPADYWAGSPVGATLAIDAYVFSPGTAFKRVEDDE